MRRGSAAAFAIFLGAAGAVAAGCAPGRTPWTGTVDMGSEHDAQTVTVGPLAPESAHDAAPAAVPSLPPAPASPPPEPPSMESVSPAPADASSSPGLWKRPPGRLARRRCAWHPSSAVNAWASRSSRRSEPRMPSMPEVDWRGNACSDGEIEEALRALLTAADHVRKTG